MSITGSNNPFACEPVVFVNANTIVSLGTITRDGNEFTFSVGFVWKINGVTYQNTAPVFLTIAEASTGFQRIDNALLNTSNTIELQQGLESETIALRPIAPDTNIILTSWNISGSTIEDTADPIIGSQFIKKTDNSSYSISQSGTNVALEIPANGASMLFLTNAALVSISGFSLVNITGNPAAEVPYNGKPFFIVNNTGVSVTLNHDETADVPFMFVGVADIVVPPSGIIEIRYAADGMSEVFKSWSEVDLSTKLDKVTTNDVKKVYTKEADGTQSMTDVSTLVGTDYLGTITPSSTPTGTGANYWTATQAGTYTNFGGVVVNANSLATISRSATGVFSISQTPIDLTPSTDSKVVSGNLQAVSGGEVYQFFTDLNNHPALVILYTGQSNAAGRVPISTATPEELEVKDNIKIWHRNTQSWQSLHIPVNNESGFNQYGSEIAFARKANELYPNRTIYLVKYSVGNTRIDYWKEGGEGRNIYEKAYLRPAIYDLLSKNKSVNIIKLFAQGEADNSATYGGSVHLDNLRTWLDEWREEIGEIPVVFSEIGSGNYSINDNFHTLKNENEKISVVPMQGKPMLDAVHFNRESIVFMGEYQFDHTPVRDGVVLGKNLPLIKHYLIRNITSSVLSLGKFTMNIDLEWASIVDGVTRVLIDGVEVSTINTPTQFGTTVKQIPNLTADGLSHTVSILNSNGSEASTMSFTYPALSVEKEVLYDFSEYVTPTTDNAKFEDWKGSHEIVTSPTGDEAIILKTATGGLYPNDSPAVRFKDFSNVQSCVMEFDTLVNDNSITKVYPMVLFRSSNSSTLIKSYRFKIRYNSVYVFMTWQGGNVQITNFTIPTGVANVWRRFRITIDGYRFIFETSEDNGVTWIVASDYTYKLNLSFGIPELGYTFYDKGEILLSSSGLNFQGAFFKNIKIRS